MSDEAQNTANLVRSFDNAELVILQEIFLMQMVTKVFGMIMEINMKLQCQIFLG